jgi:ABC-type multidrug transport system ATPase subunit
MVALLAGFRQGNRTIVITTHQRDHAAPIADWVIALRAGRVASFEPGSPTTGLRRGGGEPGSPTTGLRRGGGEPGNPSL